MTYDTALALVIEHGRSGTSSAALRSRRPPRRSRPRLPTNRSPAAALSIRILPPSRRNVMALLAVGDKAPAFTVDGPGRQDRSRSRTSRARRSSSTSIRRTTRPAAPRRPAPSATAGRSSASGRSRCSASRSTTRSRTRSSPRSSRCRSRSLADTDKAIVKAYGVWGEKSMYGRKYMGTQPRHVPDRREGQDRGGLAEGQAGGARGRDPREPWQR